MKDPLYKEPLIDYHTVLDEPIGDTAFQRQYATFPCATVSGSDSGPAAPFVTRLTPTGGLLFSSFLPGNRFSEFSTTASTVSSGDIVVATGVAASQYPFTSYFRPTSNSGSTTGALTMFARINLDTNPLPAITAVEAARVRGSSTEFHLLISGSGFNANSVVMWGGVPRPTRFATYRSLVATLSSQEVAVSGPIPVSVFNPPPGGGNSNPLLYHVNPLPVIESLSPPKTIFTEGRFTLFVMGRAFAKGVTIRMDGAEGPGLRPGDPPVLSLDFQPGTLPPPGIKTITVFNPPPGGGVSNAMTFTIAPPPQFSVASLVNAATNRPGPVTPGTLVSLFGAGLAFTTATASRVPLPIEMGGVEVRVGSSVAPLFHVSPSQINFAVPFQSQDVRATDLRLVINRVPAPPVSISLARFSPGIFTLNQQGTGQGAILIANTAAHAAPADSVPGARPARRGEVVSIYCTGLGTVSTSPSAGSPPVGTTLTAPSVTIGSEPATVTFSGLAPGFVGLYQVNVEVPAAAPEGSAVPVRLSIGGVESDTVTMAIE
jgi:uncharacterized protein (TIGR03437 family)